MSPSLFDQNIDLINNNEISLTDQGWLLIISKGQPVQDISQLAKRVKKADAPILAYIAFNHRKDHEKASALFLLTFADPEMSLEVIRQFMKADINSALKLEAFSGLTRLIAAEVDGSFKLFVNSYGQLTKNSDRQAILNDLVKNITESYTVSFDVYMNVTNFLAALITNGPEPDALYVLDMIREQEFPLAYEDAYEIIQAALFEAASTRSSRLARNALSLVQGMSI